VKSAALLKNFVLKINSLEEEDAPGVDLHSPVILSVFVVINGLVALASLPLALMTMFPSAFPSYLHGLAVAVPFSVLIMTLDVYVVGAKPSLGVRAVDFTPSDIISIIGNDETGEGVTLQSGALPAIPPMPGMLRRGLGLLPRLGVTLVLAVTVGFALNLAINGSAIAHERILMAEEAKKAKIANSEERIKAKDALESAEGILAAAKNSTVAAKDQLEFVTNLYGCEAHGNPSSWPTCTGDVGNGPAARIALVQMESARADLVTKVAAENKASENVVGKAQSLAEIETRLASQLPDAPVSGWLGTYNAFERYAEREHLSAVAKHWPEGLILVMDALPLLMKLFMGVTGSEISWWRRNYGRHYTEAIRTRVRLTGKLLSARRDVINLVLDPGPLEGPDAAFPPRGPSIPKVPTNLEGTVDVGGQTWRFLDKIYGSRNTNSEVWLALRVPGPRELNRTLVRTDIAAAKVQVSSMSEDERSLLQSLPSGHPVLLGSRGVGGVLQPGHREFQLYDYHPCTDLQRFAFSPDAADAREEITLSAACNWLSDGIEALSVLWSNGWLHNDVRLANMLVSGEWGVRVAADYRRRMLLADFGSVTRVGVATRRVVTSPTHSAPEIAAALVGGGDSLPLSYGSDIYGLFAAIYELVSGAPPSIEAAGRRAPEIGSADFAGWSRKYQNLPPSLPADVVPGAFATLVDMGLHPDPDARLGARWRGDVIDLRANLLNSVQRVREACEKSLGTVVVNPSRFFSSNMPKSPIGLPASFLDSAERHGFTVPRG
jgi:serine/threonine protein kinase